MDPERILAILSNLAALRFFPSEPGARIGLLRLVAKMCNSEEEIEWLVQRVIDLYSDWPGPAELRAVYCSRFTPRDGQVNYQSHTYPQGIPPTPMTKLLRPVPSPMPPPGAVSADPKIDRAVQLAVATVRMRSSDWSRPATAKEIAEAPAWLRALEGYHSVPTPPDEPTKRTPDENRRLVQELAATLARRNAGENSAR